MDIGVTNRRTVMHGDLRIIAVRPGWVKVGNTMYSSAHARKLADELKAPDAEMAVKLRQQADWADGKDL